MGVAEPIAARLDAATIRPAAGARHQAATTAVPLVRPMIGASAFPYLGELCAKAYDGPTLRAREFAIRLHGDQRYGDQPYAAHLLAVETVLAEFGYVTPFWQMAAWLHDTLEDTGATWNDLCEHFGEEVAGTVFAVSGFGETRAARNSDIYQKVYRDRRAAILKAADRIANIEQSIRDGSRHGKMYLAEATAFHKAVDHFLPCAMWLRLARGHSQLDKHWREHAER